MSTRAGSHKHHQEDRINPSCRTYYLSGVSQEGTTVSSQAVSEVLCMTEICLADAVALESPQECTDRSGWGRRGQLLRVAEIASTHLLSIA
jgi:hypothetical protein